MLSGFLNNTHDMGVIKLVFLSVIFLLFLVSYSFSNPWPSEVSLNTLVTMALYGVVLFLLLVRFFKKIWVLFFIVLSIFFLLVGSDNPVFKIFVDFLTFYYFLFSFLVFFYLNRIAHYSDGVYLRRYFTLLLLFSFVYVFRSYYDFLENYDYNIFLVLASHLEPHVEYLFLEPLFVFSAFFSLYYAFHSSVVVGFFYLVSSLLIASVPIVAGMRYVAISFGIYFIFLFFKRFGLLYSVVLFFSIFLLLFYFGVFDHLIYKTEVHGNNGKIEDFIAVVEAVLVNSDFGFLYGMGFGSSYVSDVLGGILSGYTHNIFSYAFLKGGILLTVVAIVWFFLFLYFLISSLFASFKSKETFIFYFLLAYFFVFIMSTLVQPGYRTLGFSLLTGFALFLIFTVKRRKYENINNIN
jgi:hypothetical protein